MTAKRALSELKPNPRNPRTITEQKRAMLKDALARFGDLGGIVVNRRSGMQIVGGHQRTVAFASLTEGGVHITRTLPEPSITGTVAEGYVDMAGERFSYREVDWDGPTETAANIAANKGAGDWDVPQLKDWLGELEAQDFSLDLTMFDADERAALGAGDEHTADDAGEDDGSIDEAPEAPAEPTTRLGDVYQLGEHQLICGDCSNSVQARRLTTDGLARLIFTDPPYNVASKNKGIAKDVRHGMQRLMQSAWDMGFDFGKVSENILKCLDKDGTAYVCASHHVAPAIWAWMSCWAEHSSYCVWSKPNPMPSLTKRHWTWNTELVCYGTRGKHTFNFPAEGNALSCWALKKNVCNDLHPTMKTVELVSHAILHSSSEGDVVADLFGGSGTTLMACEKHGRRCRMMEIAPEYCDVIVQRWETATGQQAVLIERDGRPVGNGVEN